MYVISSENCTVHYDPSVGPRMYDYWLKWGVQDLGPTTSLWIVPGFSPEFYEDFADILVMCLDQPGDVVILHETLAQYLDDEIPF